jgi:two-component system phosphate regulon sensor histidine kinase PhoR
MKHHKFAERRDVPMGIKRYRSKLTVIFIALVGLSVLSSGIFAAYWLRESHLESLRDSMYREILILAATVSWPTDPSLEARRAYFEEQAAMLRERAGARVTFIAADGAVLGDSDYEAGSMENHLDRPEIAAALKTGKVGQASRTSETLDADLLYVAVPVYENGALTGFIRLSMAQDDISRYVRGLWSYLIIGLLILFAAAAVLSYRFARGLSRPLDELMRVAAQITQMNYRARVENESRDELGQLGRAINKMASSLETQVEHIKENESRLKNVLDNMNVGVLMIDKEARIALVNPSAEKMLGFSHKELQGLTFDRAKQPLELTRMIEEGLAKRSFIRDEIHVYFPQERIVEVNLVPMYTSDDQWVGLLAALHDITELRRLENMRSEFVANVSHELKTPIAAVKGFAETLLAGAMNDPETARSFLQIIYDESGRLDRLIADILELSRIESRRIPLNFAPIDLADFIGRTLEMMRAHADGKQIALRMDVPEGLFVEADEDRLRQILINLISNGINYTPNGGAVRVRAETVHSGDEERIRLTVTDTGIGIPKQDLPRIFERFYRVDKARSRSSGGTGLGLSIVKHLVELHKGSIQVESKQGLGTTFKIELPIIHE